MIQMTEIQQNLQAITFISGEADVQAMYSLIDRLRELEYPRNFVPFLFEWFEHNSQYDLGSPGPFVHFIEEELDYFDLLVSSVTRKPMTTTVWMINRIANSQNTYPELENWINLLRMASNHHLADQDTINSALDFIKHQASRGSISFP
jgi:hypothetical protein